MKSKKQIFNEHERTIKNTIINSGYGQGFEFGLRCEQVFEDTVRKAKVNGLLAGQTSSFYRMINIKNKG